LLFAVWLTVVALPVLAIDNIPRIDARAAPVQAVSADAVDTAITAASAAPSTTGVTSTMPTDPASSSTRPTEPPTSRPTTTAPAPVTAAAKPRATPSPTAAPPTTRAVDTQTGGASWYDYNPGECAHLTIPKGTVVTVTRLGTVASVTCVVTDRGPHGGGRIIDLDRGNFAQLADPGEGVIQVRITW
jgi:rare lipoprotein A